ncbi:MAG: PEP-CTERM sorting domain-containing protein [Pirellulaceae bacterium]
MFSKTLCRLLVIGLIIATSNRSDADFVLNISDGVNFAPSVVNVNAGSTVTLSFLITESGTSFFDSPLTGLTSADFDATVAGSGITPTSFAINPSFIDIGDGAEPTGISGQEVRFNLAEPTLTGLAGVTVANDLIGGLDPSNNSIVLGTATFTIDSGAVGTRLVSIVPNADGFGDRFTRADSPSLFPVVLDVEPLTTFTFNVTAVPEPSSFGALMLLGGALTLRRRRR